jgi:hypothetical protein
MPECSQTKSMFAGPEGRYQLPASRDYVDAREANSDGATSYSRTPASGSVPRLPDTRIGGQRTWSRLTLKVDSSP